MDMAATPSTRADAARNRERIITAASTCFASDGVECQIAAIAKRAGVGNATVFRHFPTKLDLVVAVMRRRMDDLAAEVEDAARREDPGGSRDRIFACVEQLVERAKAAGEVRADLEAPDVVLLLNGICQSIGPLEMQSPGVWRRYFGLVRAAIRPQPDAPPLAPRAPTFADVERAYGG
jgi:AcrR family transcriptional regulator